MTNINTFVGFGFNICTNFSRKRKRRKRKFACVNRFSFYVSYSFQSTYNEFIYIYYAHCFGLYKLGQIELRQSIMRIVLILSHLVTKTFTSKAIAMKHVIISHEYSYMYSEIVWWKTMRYSVEITECVFEFRSYVVLTYILCVWRPLRICIECSTL